MTVKIHIIAIGRMKSGPMLDIFNDYIKRNDWQIILHEMSTKFHSQSEEAAALIKKIPTQCKVIALDERGDTKTNSVQLSRKIQDWIDHGHHEIAFIIGGADGLDQTIRERSDYLLSFGRLTWPHMLVRVMLSEQIYRINSIIKNHPYHRE